VNRLPKKRSNFVRGEKEFMLITERFHFFRRFRLRGAHRVVFYDLPEHSQFYPDLVNFLLVGGGDEEDMTVDVMFSKYDMLKLERVVGTKRCASMSRAVKNVFTFA
jgi:U3 small nucleolar RNA-associated protein 25